MQNHRVLRIIQCSRCMQVRTCCAQSVSVRNPTSVGEREREFDYCQHATNTAAVYLAGDLSAQWWRGRPGAHTRLVGAFSVALVLVADNGMGIESERESGDGGSEQQQQFNEHKMRLMR